MLLLPLLFFVYTGCLSANYFVSATTNKELAQEFLLRNNEVRRAVLTCSLKNQPPAKKLPYLVWNVDLSKKAQAWVDTCALGLDSQKNRALPQWKWVGQNWAAAPSIEAAFAHWRKGHEKYNFTQKSCSDERCGEYTQIVWADTIAVGCGIKNCTTKKDFPNTYAIACNYAPGGNIVGQSPYVVGTKKNCIAAVAKAMDSKLTVQAKDSFGVKWSFSPLIILTCQLLYFVLIPPLLV